MQLDTVLVATSHNKNMVLKLPLAADTDWLAVLYITVIQKYNQRRMCVYQTCSFMTILCHCYFKKMSNCDSIDNFSSVGWQWIVWVCVHDSKWNYQLGDNRSHHCLGHSGNRFDHIGSLQPQHVGCSNITVYTFVLDVFLMIELILSSMFTCYALCVSKYMYSNCYNSFVLRSVSFLIIYEETC